jgi:hypothetical protein
VAHVVMYTPSFFDVRWSRYLCGWDRYGMRGGRVITGLHEVCRSVKAKPASRCKDQEILADDTEAALIRHISGRDLRFGCFRLMRSTASHLRSFTVIVNLISRRMTPGIPFLFRAPAPPRPRVAG